MNVNTFIQFPLCALSFPSKHEGVLNHILSHGMIEAGVAVMNKMEDEEKIERCDEFGISNKLFKSYTLAAHLGAETCGMTIGSLEDSIERHRALREHRDKWERVHGKDAQVRMRKDVCFEVRDGGQMSWREFRVLAGINSVIGSKPYAVLIRASTIGVRSRGCMSLEIEKQATKKRGVRFTLPEPFTPKQLRLTVDRLHELGWFARVTPDPHGRATYYSNRMGRDEMREKLFKKRTFGVCFHAEQRAKNAELVERVQIAKGTFNKKTEKGTFNNGSEAGQTGGTVGAPLGHVGDTATAPERQQEGHREGTFNRNPLNTNSGNRNPLNQNSQNTNPLNDGASALGVEGEEESRKKAEETLRAAITVATNPEPLEEDYSMPVPTREEWRQFLDHNFPDDFKGFTPPWEACRTQHRLFRQWASEMTEGF